jgi:anthranilate phosphoribosyltransferase
MAANAKHPGYVSVTPLLKQLATLTGALQATPKDIAAAVTLVFEDRISPIQFSLLLWALHTTGMDHNPEVLASTAKYMRSAAAQVDRNALRSAIAAKAKPEGNYRGGLVSLLEYRLPVESC